MRVVEVFLLIVLPWANCVWNFMCMFVHCPLDDQTTASEKEKISVKQKWEKSNGDCIFSSLLQCWWRRRKSFMVCPKSPAEKVDILKQFMLFILAILMSAVNRY